MPASVRLRDGIEIELGDGETVVADARSPDPEATAVYSHAHGDHLYDDPPTAACWSEATRALAAVRRADCPVPDRVDDPRINLLDSGHVPGSRAALIEGPDERVLYTGDVCTRDRFFLSGFDPPPADVLVVESTYGDPDYVFPPHAEEMAVAREWLGEAATSGPVLLFGYSLGRAQQLQRLCAEAALERVFVTDAIARLNRVVEQYVSCRFDAPTYDADVALGPGDAVVLPSQTKSLAFVDAMVEETGALTAGFSGWAVDSSFRYANDFDRTFVLSDHCDYPELLDLVAAVDPDRVYTHHGAARTLAATLTADLGYPATALVRNQTSLAEF